VHWYARDASVQTWVDSYNAATGAKDTFVYAPPISLHNYAKKGLPSAGLYSDQVRDSLAGVLKILAHDLCRSYTTSTASSSQLITRQLNTWLTSTGMNSSSLPI
jgi:hypothetical protein